MLKFQIFSRMFIGYISFIAFLCKSCNFQHLILSETSMVLSPSIVSVEYEFAVLNNEFHNITLSSTIKHLFPLLHYSNKCRSVIIGHSTLLELAQGFELVTPDP